MADLMRVRGIGDATAELLVTAGIDLGRLRRRRAEQIEQRLCVANQLLKLLPRTPSIDRIERWQRQASALVPLVRL